MAGDAEDAGSYELHLTSEDLKFFTEQDYDIDPSPQQEYEQIKQLAQWDHDAEKEVQDYSDSLEEITLPPIPIELLSYRKGLTDYYSSRKSPHRGNRVFIVACTDGMSRGVSLHSYHHPATREEPEESDAWLVWETLV